MGKGFSSSKITKSVMLLLPQKVDCFFQPHNSGGMEARQGRILAFFCVSFMFFKGVGECVNKMIELFIYDIYLWCD